MPGQWIETPQGEWVWDDSAPAGDPSPTLIQNSPYPPSHELGTPRQEADVSELDPAETAPSPPVYAQAAQPDDDEHVAQSMAGLDGTRLAICPTCGTGVAASRLKEQG